MGVLHINILPIYDYWEWLDQYIYHLEKMYDQANLPALECDFDEFCNWVFSNSTKGKNDLNIN